MDKSFRHYYEFGPFRLDPQKHRLLREGEIVPLSPKALEALLVLVVNPGKPLERDALMRAVWAEAFVEDANLTVAISQLRKALGNNGEGAEYIETIPRVGYRFAAEVRQVSEEVAPLIIEKRTRSQTVIEEEILQDEHPAREKNAAIAVRSSIVRSLGFSLRSNRKAALLATAALGAVVVAAAVYFKLAERRSGASTSSAISSLKSIAVLPPKTLSGVTENPSLNLGIADALITRLAGLNKLAVRPTSAVVGYLDGNQDPLVAGRALGVDAVLDGTLQRDAGRVRVTLRLVNVANGAQLWSGNFDEADADIFKLQDSVAQQVGATLFANLSRNEKAFLVKQQTRNPEAYAQYLNGNYFWSKRSEHATKSLQYFRKAIDLDPNFAQAYVGLATVDAAASIPSPEAEALIERALQLDNTLAEAHATYGFIRMFHHWDWSTAEQELNRAIELSPNSSVAHHWKGVYLSLRGRLNEAKAEMHRALDLDPLSLIIMADLGQLHYFAHEYDQALEYCNRALALDPEFWVAHEYLVDIYRAKGMDEEALNEFLKVEHRDDTPETKTRIKQVFTRGGLRAVFAHRIGSQLSVPTGEHGPTPIVMAKFYSRVRDNEQALYWLDRAVNEQKFFPTAYIKIDPLYESLRGDPRFTRILQRLGS